MNLLPWEFWALTPREFTLKLEGFFRSVDRQWHHTGTLGTWSLSPWVKKGQPMTLRRLLGRPLQLWPKAPDQE